MNLITDGCEVSHASCGGWAYLRSDGKQANGHRWRCGSNKMELIAVINGLYSIAYPTDVTVFTDSNYVIVNACRKRKSDPSMIVQLKDLMRFHQVNFVKIKSGTDRQHNYVHHLAREAMFDAIRVREYQSGIAQV